MTLYEIDEAIESCVDEETGEILDVEALNNLNMARDEKVENLALWYKDLMSDAEALKAEKTAFANREKIARNKAEAVKKYLSSVLQGEKFETSKCKLSFRRSKAVNVNIDEFLLNDNAEMYLRYKEPEVNKTELKKAIENGATFMGASVIENQSIQIK